MGFVYVEVWVRNPADLGKGAAVELLVDTGAVFVSVPRAILESLGLQPITRRKLRVYGGGVVERDIGSVVIEYEDRRAGVTVIFGEAEDAAVLGVTALESLGYELDPVAKKLKPVELLMLL